MAGLKELTTFAEPGPRRHFVRSVGSDERSTPFNTWSSRSDAENYVRGMRELNPDMEFEIVDLLEKS